MSSSSMVKKSGNSPEEVVTIFGLMVLSEIRDGSCRTGEFSLDENRLITEKVREEVEAENMNVVVHSEKIGKSLNSSGKSD